MPVWRISVFSQQEARGLKHPEAVKAKQKRREEAERQAKAAGNTGDTALKVICTSVHGIACSSMYL